ncbi:DNA mismatch repair endonuclease MutL [Brevifollis gellanilyticus]|uniref:DNA mismatch repair protein MutL n=1 Tax=Brevifollis gellanilyticus TaxID=748831 RepID=A0A512MFF9_9BACT|nr:DNA mismatch repair endonuclease MutL [Brevifollis gellanilyticus]GEP45467.1 DNA mismatch repair protein MutL [Brevifollis gellanilyticus]
MSKIRILPDALASQVAAGEVVERPAAVIRELVENSLDAGSTHITVEVQRGGTAMIRVVDDGCGMNREDALLSIERHATSKIRTKEDLAAILTFGFRGEALPSIASVTRFRIATREKEALSGTEVEINGGKLSAVKDYGGAAGTLIEARSLFFNVPARRKFLRTEATEYSHIEQQFIVHAMAHPEVTFTLIRDGSVAFHLPATKDALDRVRGLVGDQLASRLIKVEPTEHKGIRVWGYIGGPGLSRSNRQQQITFLNGRPIESSSINYGLREGFHTSLMKGQHPVTVLFIEMDAEGYDINVHPAKREVRFHDGFAVRDALAKAVSRALEAANKLPQGHVPPSQMARPLPPQIAVPQQQSFALHTPASLVLKSETPITMPAPRPAPLPNRSVMPVSRTTPVAEVAAERPKPPVVEAAKPLSKVDVESGTEPEEQGTEAQPDPQEPTREVEMPRFRILGVLHRLYILLESDEGLVLMDQHAAHERVNFEKMRRAMEQGGVPSQRLLMPLTLQVTPRDADILRRHQETLARLGIEVEPFGPNIFKVEALPTFLKTDDPVTWLDQVIEELQTLSAKGSSLRLGEDMIATTVCRHSIKANDKLSMPEIEALLRDLFACEMPYCCPHGRPTLIQMSLKELEKKFGRVGP